MSSQRRAHVARAGRVGRAHVDLADVERVAVEAERRGPGRAARRGTAAPPGATAAKPAAIASGFGVQTMATSTSSLPWRSAPSASARSRRSGRGSRTHTASTARAWAAAIGEQPAGARSRRRAGCRRRAGRSASKARSTQASGSTKVARSASRPSSDEQLADEVGRHADALGEAARVQAPSPGSARTASRGRAGSAGTRRTARGGARRRDRPTATPVDVRRRPRSTSPASSWPSTVGTLRATHASSTSEPQTPQASTRQTTSPRPGVGVGAPPRRGPRAGVTRARDPHASSAAMDAASGGRATPRSVTSAVTSAAGRDVEGRVAHGGARAASSAAPPKRAHLVAVALLDLDLVAVGQRGVDRRRRAGDDERDAGRARRRAPAGRCRPCWRCRRWRRRGRQPTIDRVDLAAADQPGHRAVDDELVARRRRAPAPTPSAARPAAAAASRRRARGRAPRCVQREDDRQRRALAAGGERAGVAVRERSGARPASRSAPCGRDRRRRRRPPRRGCARPRRARRRPSPAGPAASAAARDAVDGVGEVDGGRARARAAAPSRARACRGRAGRATSIASP